MCGGCRHWRAISTFQSCTPHLEEQTPLASKSRWDTRTITHFVQLEKKQQHPFEIQPPLSSFSQKRTWFALRECSILWFYPWAATDGFQRNLYYYNSASVSLLFLPLQKTSSWFNPRQFLLHSLLQLQNGYPVSWIPQLYFPFFSASGVLYLTAATSQPPQSIHHTPRAGELLLWSPVALGAALEQQSASLWRWNMKNQQCSALSTPDKPLEHLPQALATCL